MTKERLVTPVGEAKWAHLTKPKPPFKGDKEKGAKYQIDVVFDPADPAWKAWASDIKVRSKKAGKNVPIRPELDADNQPTGRYMATFKTGEQYKPQVFGLPEGQMVGNGSKVRVSFTPAAYEGFGGGVTLYLNAVQVVELVAYQPNSPSAYGFDPASTHPIPLAADEWEDAGPIPEDETPF